MKATRRNALAQERAEREELERLTKQIELIRVDYFLKKYPELHARIFSSPLVTYIRYEE